MLTRLAPVQREQGTDAGLSLVEVMVTMILMLVVGGLCLSGVINTHQTFRSTDDEARGLSDVRTVVERLGRDIRDARGVEPGGAPNYYPAATASQLSVWIDYNSNYRKESDEIVTWRLAAGAANQFNVIRTVNGSSDVIVARTLVDAIAFSYDVAAPGTRSVSVNLQYDAVTTGGSGRRTTVFTDRLRNVS